MKLEQTVFSENIFFRFLKREAEKYFLEFFWSEILKIFGRFFLAAPGHSSRYFKKEDSKKQNCPHFLCLHV